jgi:hypothetical protein
MTKVKFSNLYFGQYAHRYTLTQHVFGMYVFVIFIINILKDIFNTNKYSECMYLLFL